MRLGTIIICALLCVQSLLAQKLTDFRQRTLEASSPKSIGVPAFGFFDLPKCDKDGDLFFHTGSMQYMQAWIMELPHSLSETTTFKIPYDLQDQYKFLEYAVSPSGVVWVLTNNDAGDTLALEFNSKGEVRTKSKLELALDQVDVQDFAALDNGTLFLSGTYTNKAPDHLSDHIFTAFFNGETGQKIKDLNDTFSPASKEKPLIHEGEAVAADDGNIYLLHQEQVITLSPTGEIVKRSSFTKPVAGVLATHLRVSSGEAAIWLATIQKDTHKVEHSFLILDLLSGQTSGWYVVPPGMAGSPVAFSRADGIIFMNNNHGELETFTAALR